jgi:hypothetical protein
VGPAAFLQTMLNAADREVDRIRAKYRAEKVHDYMKDVDAEKAQNALPSFCSHLMQSFSTDDRAAMQTRIDNAYEDAKPDGLAVDSRAYNLGLIIMDYMGEEVLKAGVEALKPQIKNEPSVG